MVMFSRILISTAIGLTAASEVALATFDDDASTRFTFKELNDPVMGGKSVGSWKVDETGMYGVFDGEVKDVPSLSAPGFIKTAADGSFADVSAAISGDLILTVRSTTPDYAGFRVSFAAGALSPAYACAGGGGIPFSRGCYKAKFSVPKGEDFTEIRIPFNSFSDMWSSATGEQTETCADNADVCPTAAKLQNLQRIEVWAEGALGTVHLEIKSISAGASNMLTSSATQKKFGASPPDEFNTCKGPIQPNLKYGISTRVSPEVPVFVNANESLAAAVCCDSRVKAFGEPQFLFDSPDISLFSKLEISGPTTFYDAVCGIPLFRSPVNRTMEDFKADTTEHGWPSFRTGEVFTKNIIVGENNELHTACGTHLGTYLPDAKGPRWCIDLSCISGNPTQ